MTQIVFTSVEFRNFKAFRRFSVSLGDTNILVGPNNCGKSTVISALRILSAGLKRANARRPDMVTTPDGERLGYPVSAEDMSVSLENVHTDYSEQPSVIRFRLSNNDGLG